MKKDGKYMCSECDTLYDYLITGCPHCNKLENAAKDHATKLLGSEEKYGTVFHWIW